MRVVTYRRRKNFLVRINKSESFRDDRLTLSKKKQGMSFLTIFENPNVTYEVITKALPNGTYKVKVESMDNLGNRNVGIEGTQVISTFPLPPKNVEASVSGSVVTLTWEHSSQGAPTNYKLYGNGGSGNTINRDVVLKLIGGTALTASLTLSDGDWKLVLEAVSGSKESVTQNIIEVTVPDTDLRPPRPGIPGQFQETGLVLSRESVGKAKLAFLWLHGSLADSFDVYFDNATGTVDFVTPLDNFVRQAGTFQKYTTVQLHLTDDEKTYLFAVRAKNSLGNLDTNQDIYSIVIDGKAPDNASDLILGTVF